MFRRNEKEGMVWYSSTLLEEHPELIHAALSRHGANNGEDLHLAFNAEQISDEKVRADMRGVERILKLPPAAFVRQTHSSNFTIVLPTDNYQPMEPKEIRQNCDALIGPKAGVSLLIRLADCQGIFLYEPQSKMLAVVHSGWRGSVVNILGVTVDKMIGLGAKAAKIKAAIAPSLGPCCAEFINHKEELPDDFREFMIKDNYFDFWSISRKQLIDKGLEYENVDISGICTKCSDEFYSYRRGDWRRHGIIAYVAP